MIELTNRELASVILVAVLIGILVVVPKLRRKDGSNFNGILRKFFVWDIQLPLLIYFAYTFAVVYLAWQLGAWDSTLLKDTLIVVFFIGLPMVFSANRVTAGTKLVREVVRDTVGVSALLVFYLGLASLPLLGELLLQPLLLVLTVLAVVAHHNPEHRPAEKLVNALLGFIGVSLIAYTTKLVFTTWDADTISDAAASFILSVWLPIALLPFVYVFAFIMHVEVILRMLTFFNDGKQPKLPIRLACVWGLHFSTRLASEFRSRWRGELARSAGFHTANQTMGKFRHAIRERDRALEAHEIRLRLMTGVPGTDDDGDQLDRREFHATKKELTNLYFMQMGWHRNRGGTYRPELLDFLGDMTTKGLPKDHGIHLVVRGDKQAWRAWRQTPSGWHFGVGGTRDLLHQWRYDGSTPPSGFPSANGLGWINTTLHQDSPEWRRDDEPPTRVE